ncbi:MAG: SpoIID/LytB domain-containing protein [Oscillospiraceae bacterium]|nr:SpoIID/LytB domain-containing protein [Oscillospiraceae bacterium]
MMRRLCLILPAAVGLLLLCGILLHRKKATAADAYYRVYRTETGTAEEIPVRDYLIGTVGAEIPPSFHPEALKAQTAAAHTYAEYFRRQQAAHPDPALHGAELSDDSAHCQAYLPPELLRERYGDAAYAAVEAAVDVAGSLLVCWDGEPALTVYHACSSGMTESAEHVWGTAVPYLIPVDSPADRDAPEPSGHGVGMSQYGADALAKQGYGFGDILQHYYPGTVLLPQETPQQKDCFCFYFAGIKTFLKLDESD